MSVNIHELMLAATHVTADVGRSMFRYTTRLLSFALLLLLGLELNPVPTNVFHQTVLASSGPLGVVAYRLTRLLRRQVFCELYLPVS